MIFKTIKSLPKKINFINTKEFDFEDDFFILNNLFQIKEFKLQEVNDQNINYLTLNLDFYFKNKDNMKLDLLVISIDNDNSHYFNLIKYIKTNKLKKVQYKKKFFKKFLFENFPLKKINSKINRFLSYVGIRVSKYKLNKYITIPKFHKRENVHKGFEIGVSSYNVYVPKDKNFDKKFEYVISNLSNNNSKKIYFSTIYGDPSQVWKNYYHSLFDNEHYQDYLNFDDANIINLGVDNGFEIPFFVTNKINKLINVDPTEEKNLHQYVKAFVNNYKSKIIFDKSFLYDPKNVYVEVKEDNEFTNLSNLIKKYDCNKNLLIKSDIDGLEIKMLEELKELIPKTRPQLAISIYHVDKNLYPRHSHLVLLPEKLINICKDYYYFVKHYTYNRRETVFFCIPKEKLNLN